MMASNPGPLSAAAYACALLVSILGVSHLAHADPILATSVGSCAPVPIRIPGEAVVCCLPNPSKPAVPFQFPREPIRERKPVHVVARDPNYVRKYNEAYRRMKALPDSDPRSYAAQWKIHCVFCQGALRQRRLDGSETGVPLQVHYSWNFLPWHRALLYFHERILAWLINDPTFALPFWNWDNTLDPEAGVVSNMFLQNQFLVSPRNPVHYPPKRLDLAWAFVDTNITEDELTVSNLNKMHVNVANSVSSREFFGGATVIGDPGSRGESGACENIHNPAHIWVGPNKDCRYPNNEDMGTFIYAGRDPLFYTHHGNVDRLWAVWENLPDTSTAGGQRRRQAPQNPDFLNTEYTFFDENGEFVKLSVKDTLDITKLGYKYTDMSASDDKWINFEARSAIQPRKPWSPSDFPEALPGSEHRLTSEPSTFRLKRRAPTEADLEGKPLTSVDQLIENIVIQSVWIPRSMYVEFDIFVNQPRASAKSSLDSTSYVGTYVQLSNGRMSLASFVEDDTKLDRVVNMRYSINSALRNLRIDDPTQDIAVTIVTKSQRPSVEFPFAAIVQKFD